MTASMTFVCPPSLSVWPCAQTTAQHQRVGRYDPASFRHPAKMVPELARRIIDAYTQPGQVVVDPMGGIGTTAVEAAGLGRRGIVVELEPRWAAVARANLRTVLTPSQRRLAEVRVGDARQLTTVLADMRGTVDAVVTSPPYACSVAMIDRDAWDAGGDLCAKDTLNYSSDRRNVGHARGASYAAEMTAIYAECWKVLRPGGLLITVTKNMRDHGRLIDLVGVTVALAETAGFEYRDHAVALLAAVRGDSLLPRPSFWQRLQVGAARSRGEPVCHVGHEDVLVFGRPARGPGR